MSNRTTPLNLLEDDIADNMILYFYYEIGWKQADELHLPKFIIIETSQRDIDQTD